MASEQLKYRVDFDYSAKVGNASSSVRECFNRPLFIRLL